eukprot:g9788.t1
MLPAKTGFKFQLKLSLDPSGSPRIALHMKPEFALQVERKPNLSATNSLCIILPGASFSTTGTGLSKIIP